MSPVPQTRRTQASEPGEGRGLASSERPQRSPAQLPSPNGRGRWKFPTGERLFFFSFLFTPFCDYFSPFKRKKKINKETFVLLCLRWLCLGTTGQVSRVRAQRGDPERPGTRARPVSLTTLGLTPAHPAWKSPEGARRAPETGARPQEPDAGAGPEARSSERQRGRQRPADGDRGPRSRGSRQGGNAASAAASPRCPPPAAHASPRSAPPVGRDDLEGPSCLPVFPVLSPALAPPPPPPPPPPCSLFSDHFFSLPESCLELVAPSLRICLPGISRVSVLRGDSRA